MENWKNKENWNWKNETWNWTATRIATAFTSGLFVLASCMTWVEGYDTYYDYTGYSAAGLGQFYGKLGAFAAFVALLTIVYSAYRGQVADLIGEQWDVVDTVGDALTDRWRVVGSVGGLFALYVSGSAIFFPWWFFRTAMSTTAEIGRPTLTFVPYVAGLAAIGLVLAPIVVPIYIDEEEESPVDSAEAE